jgi:hypothetical protein
LWEEPNKISFTFTGLVGPMFGFKGMENELLGMSEKENFSGFF